MEFSDELLDAYQSLHEDYLTLLNKYLNLQNDYVKLSHKYLDLLDEKKLIRNPEDAYREDFKLNN